MRKQRDYKLLLLNLFRTKTRLKATNKQKDGVNKNGESGYQNGTSDHENEAGKIKKID